jgi:hypothetical protein
MDNHLPIPIAIPVGTIRIQDGYFMAPLWLMLLLLAGVIRAGWSGHDREPLQVATARREDKDHRHPLHRHVGAAIAIPHRADKDHYYDNTIITFDWLLPLAGTIKKDRIPVPRPGAGGVATPRRGDKEGTPHLADAAGMEVAIPRRAIRTGRPGTPVQHAGIVATPRRAIRTGARARANASAARVLPLAGTIRTGT